MTNIIKELALTPIAGFIAWLAFKPVITELQKIHASMERRAHLAQKRHEYILRALERQTAAICDNTRLIKPLAVEQWYRGTDQIIREIQRADPDGTLTCEQLQDIRQRVHALELANPNAIHVN